MKNVSILTPSFNSGRFLEQTIKSVQIQDYQRIEHIVIDGGSVDETQDILKRYSNAITWISEPDNGQSDALCKGFDISKGEIIGWINADDIYTPGTISRATRFFDEYPQVDVVYSGCFLIDEVGRVIQTWQTHDFSLKDLLFGDYFIHQPTIFLRRQVIEKAGFVNASLHYVMDYELWLRLGRNFRFGVVPGVGAGFRIHTKSKTLSQAIKFNAERLVVLDHFFSSTDENREYEEFRHEAIARAHIMSACSYYELSRPIEGAKDMESAADLAPDLLFDEERLLPLLIGHTSFDGNHVRLISSIFDNLPPRLDYMKAWRRRATNWARVALAFSYSERGNYGRAIVTAVVAILEQPKWILNRGVLSIIRRGFSPIRKERMSIRY